MIWVLLYDVYIVLLDNTIDTFQGEKKNMSNQNRIMCEPSGKY